MKADPNTALLDQSSSAALAVYFSDKKHGDFVEFKIVGRLRDTEGTLQHVQIDKVILPEQVAGLPGGETDDEDADDDIAAVMP